MDFIKKIKIIITLFGILQNMSSVYNKYWDYLNAY